MINIRPKHFFCPHNPSPLSYRYRFQKVPGSIIPETFPIRSVLLIIFAFSRRFRFLFTFYARFLVMLSFTDFLLDTGFRTTSFETT